MRVESGPAKADRNWQVLRAVLFLGFACWFVLDGAYRWPNKNRRLAEEALKNPTIPFAFQVKYDQLGDRPDKSDVERLQASGKATRENLEGVLGKAQFVQNVGPGQTKEHFMSRWGYAVVPVDKERNLETIRLTQAQWKLWGDGAKDRGQIKGQFVWAIVPAIPGLYFLWRACKAATLRVVIDDQGMRYGTRSIPFNAMVSLRDYNPKGWIDLYYKEGEVERKLRLDNEKVLLFDEIVDAICQTKGFANEVKEYATEKARSQAEAAAAEQAEATAAADAAQDDEAPKA